MYRVIAILFMNVHHHTYRLYMEGGKLYLSEQVGLVGEKYVDIIKDQDELNKVWEEVEFHKSAPTINDDEAIIVA